MENNSLGHLKLGHDVWQNPNMCQRGVHNENCPQKSGSEDQFGHFNDSFPRLTFLVRQRACLCQTILGSAPCHLLFPTPRPTASAAISAPCPILVKGQPVAQI